MDDMFNPELLEGLDEFDDEGDSFRIESPIEIVNKDMTHVEDKKPIAIIGIIIFMVIIVIVSALIFNVYNYILSMFTIIIITVGAIIGYVIARLFVLVFEVLADIINLLF